MNKRFLHNGAEVKLTGRTATRTIGKENSRKGTREDIQHEVTPVDNEEGSWKVWVRLNELYEITDDD